MWVSSVSFLAYANSSVKLDMALAVLTASIKCARTDALLIVARFVVGTVGVVGTFWSRYYKFTINAKKLKLSPSFLHRKKRSMKFKEN